MKTCPKMQAFAEQLTAHHDVDLSEVGAHLRLDLPGLDRLSIERLIDKDVVCAQGRNRHDGLQKERSLERKHG